METDCDDQASGWLEVKKKHRTSSKFSIQGSIRGISNATSSSFPRNHSSVSERIGNSQTKRRTHGSKVGQGFTKTVQSGNAIFAMEEAETAVQCLDKCIVSQGTELPSSPSAKSSHITSLNYNSGNVQVVAQKEKSDMIPKIKWGNLEDDALVLCRETLDMTEIKFGNLGEDKALMCRKLGNTDDSVSSGSCTDPREDKSVVTTEDADDLPAETVLLSPSNKSLKPNQGDFNEKCPEGTDLLGEHRKMPNLENSSPRKIEHEHGRPIEINLNDGLNFNVPGSEHSFSLVVDSVRTPMSPQGQEDNPEEAAVDISEVPDEGSLSMVVSEKDSVLPEVPKSVSETSGDVPVSDTDKHRNQSEDGIISEDCPGTQLMNAPTEGESGESKERFRQRLWCFLFENLNRAVDELYLLCELECDSEQIKESILVLEEAGSDFKELKSRVEGFEIMKKSSSQPPVDGLLLNEKTDHRRPHALSWEVRRMTASPHRAEILSSSLEAFKKIQNERTSTRKVHDTKFMDSSVNNHFSSDLLGKLAGMNDRKTNAGESIAKSRKQSGALEPAQRQGARATKVYRIHDSQLPPQNLSTLDSNVSQILLKNIRPTSVSGKSKKESHTSASDSEKQVQKKDKMLTEGKSEKNPKYMEPLKRQITPLDREKEKEKKNSALWKSMNAWKEKRNWEDILTSPIRISSRVSHSPGMSRKSVERARILHDKLMSPEKKKKTALDLRKEAEEKHARAMKIRSELENERVQRLQRTSEKLNRVNEWQAVRTMKLREGMHARHQRNESRYEAHLAQVVRRAGDESSKVNEVRFITSLNEENKKFILRQKLHDSQLRRDEKLQIIKSKQKEDMAREEAVVERRKILQAEKLQRLAETQRKKEEALVRREEERKASSAAREARAIEQLRRKEIRAKAQQEEAELLAQKLAERLNESEQRRKFYLEQIREKASMDFRDQSSPLLRRSSNKDSLGRSISTSNGEDYQATNISSIGNSSLRIGDSAQQLSLKRRIKKIRQRLMALKYEFSEPPVSAESVGIGYRSLVGTARAKIGRWLQDLQKLRQARKEGAGSIGLIVADMIKFLEGKEPELHASRQAGLLDFIASALPASHTPRPEACQVTIYLLRLVRVVLSLPANRSYFLAQNLLPPIIPMLSAAIENYIKIAASLNISGSNSSSSKTSVENFESVSEVLEGYLWTVTSIIGHGCSDERQLQMKDGLLELVISCQVIHRLRDLFALHDRPQVEGSPFPSSIVLSLNLLAVVTSRSGTGSTIDWGSFPSKTFSAGETKEVKHEEFLDLTDPSSNVTDGGYRSPLSAGSVTADRPLSNVPEDWPLDESTMRKHENSPLSARNPDKGLTDDRSIDFNHVSSDLQMHVTDATGQKNDNIQDLKQPVTYLLSVIVDTGLVSLPSLLTAVLLQANNRLSTEQASYVLPSNFEEVATGVLKVLNNLAHLDLTLMQRMLARPDLKMEFFHFMSFLLSHCTSKWKMAGDQVGLLLLESLLLLGYFALFHPGNQAVLRWGKSPTILHKVCDLPFVFFSDPELMPILAGTLVGACYGCEQNRCVVQQELSTEMLLSLLGSCRNGLPTVQASPSLLDTTGDRDEANQLVPEAKKAPVDTPVKSGRHILRNSKVSSGKGVSLGSSTRVSKVRNHSKVMKTCEDWAIKHNHPASEASSSFMLHCRFPSSFIDRAEEFFSSGIPNVA